MVLIIDGYNLLFEPSWNPPGANLEQQREFLIKKVIQYRKCRKYSKIILVFDGQISIQNNIYYEPYNNYYSDFKIIYALDEGRADEKIIELAREMNGVVAVSADHKIIRKVKAAHGKMLPPEEFIHELQNIFDPMEEIREKEHSCSDKEIKDWLKTFHLKEEIEIPDKFYSPNALLKKRKK